MNHTNINTVGGLLQNVDACDTGLPGVTYSAFVRRLFRPMDKASMFTHAVLGLCTEHQEALLAPNKENYIEELGDYQFFLVAMIQQLDADVVGSLDLRLVGQLADKLEQEAQQCHRDFDGCLNGEPAPADFASAAKTALLDIAKRWLAYGKEPNAEATQQAVAAALALQCSLDMDCMEECDGPVMPLLIRTNVAKLEARYKGTFSTEQALNRDTQGEMNALSAAVPNA